MANFSFKCDNYSTTTASHSWGSKAQLFFNPNLPTSEQGSTPKGGMPSNKISVIAADAGTNPLDAPLLITDLAEEKEANEFRAGLISSLESDVFEPDRKSITERYVEQWLARKPNLAKIVIIRLFLESRKNDKRIIGILNLLAHLDPVKFHPANEMIAIGAFSHQSNEVKECALRAFEYWESAELAEGLKAHRLTPQWLDDYRLTIISDICGEK